jgi:hypothetical protein
VVEDFHSEGVNWRITPYPFEVGKVNLLRCHAALMPYVVEIALLEVLQG